MGRIPCCEKDNVKRGQRTPEEDNKLASYIAQHGLHRCGKSCRLRWTNYLRPDLKHGQFSEAEEQVILKLHSVLGNRWSLIAKQLPGRTDNDVKNHWNTKLKKKLSGMGIGPVTHKPFSHLMAEIATTLNPPHMTHLAVSALGCFKDEMLHLLTKKRIDLIHLHNETPISIHIISINQDVNGDNNDNDNDHNDDDSVDRIKMNITRAFQESEMVHPSGNKMWENLNGFLCTGGSRPDFGNMEGSDGGKEIIKSADTFGTDCVLCDLQADDLINHMV